MKLVEFLHLCVGTIKPPQGLFHFESIVCEFTEESMLGGFSSGVGFMKKQ